MATKDPRGEMKASPTTVGQSMSDAADKTFNLGHVKEGMDADKAAARAAANRKEAAAEGQKYKAGGMVRRGYGKARGA